MSQEKTGAFIGGVLLGGAVGTIVGLLVAPRTGRETRQLIKKSADALPDLAEDLSTTVQLQTDRFSISAMRNWEGTLERLKEAVSAGVEATQLQAEELKNSSNTISESSSSSSEQHL